MNQTYDVYTSDYPTPLKKPKTDVQNTEYDGALAAKNLFVPGFDYSHVQMHSTITGADGRTPETDRNYQLWLNAHSARQQATRTPSSANTPPQIPRGFRETRDNTRTPETDQNYQLWLDTHGAHQQSNSTQSSSAPLPQAPEKFSKTGNEETDRNHQLWLNANAARQRTTCTPSSSNTPPPRMSDATAKTELVARIPQPAHNLELWRSSHGDGKPINFDSAPAICSTTQEPTGFANGESSSERAFQNTRNLSTERNYPTSLDDCVRDKKLDLILVGKYLKKVRNEKSEHAVQIEISKFVSVNHGIESKCSEVNDMNDAIYASNGQQILNLLNSRHIYQLKLSKSNDHYALRIEVVQPCLSNIIDTPKLPMDVEWPFKPGQKISFKWLTTKKLGMAPHQLISCGIQAQVEDICEKPEFQLYITYVLKPKKTMLVYEELRNYEAREENVIMPTVTEGEKEQEQNKLDASLIIEGTYQKDEKAQMKQLPENIVEVFQKTYRQLLGLDHKIFKKNMLESPDLPYDPVFIGLSSNESERIEKYIQKRDAYNQFEMATFRQQLQSALSEYRRSTIFVNMETGARRVKKNPRNNEQRKLETSESVELSMEPDQPIIRSRHPETFSEPNQPATEQFSKSSTPATVQLPNLGESTPKQVTEPSQPTTDDTSQPIEKFQQAPSKEKKQPVRKMTRNRKNV